MPRTAARRVPVLALGLSLVAAVHAQRPGLRRGPVNPAFVEVMDEIAAGRRRTITPTDMALDTSLRRCPRTSS